jgi:hypothetical protein
VVPNFSDLTQDMLDHPEKYIKNMNFSNEILYWDYWLKQIDELKIKYSDTENS